MEDIVLKIKVWADKAENEDTTYKEGIWHIQNLIKEREERKRKVPQKDIDVW